MPDAPEIDLLVLPLQDLNHFGEAVQPLDEWVLDGLSKVRREF